MILFGVGFWQIPCFFYLVGVFFCQKTYRKAMKSAKLSLDEMQAPVSRMSLNLKISENTTMDR